jgi:ADP-ribosylglycohydrolase
MLVDKIAGALVGAALGDALGAPTEFMQVKEILHDWPPSGPMAPILDRERGVYLVTDDTQMMLAVGKAMMESQTHGLPLTETLRETFVAWLHDPDNDRAPGSTCLRACRDLERGKPWVEATVTGSKGCGANMRVQPVGLLPLGRVSDDEMDDAAQLQAALTHGHPTALAAASLTAAALRLLLLGHPPARLPALLRAWLKDRWGRYPACLGSLWEAAHAASQAAYIERGQAECLAVLDKLDAALLRGDQGQDPCLETGDAWIAEEALATGLLCFLWHPDDPVAAIRRAAVTRGDSDSIGCLAGAFAGARHGLTGWPLPWVARVEYQRGLFDLAHALGEWSSPQVVRPLRGA